MIANVWVGDGAIWGRSAPNFCRQPMMVPIDRSENPLPRSSIAHLEIPPAMLEMGPVSRIITFRCYAMAVSQQVRGKTIGKYACVYLFRMQAHASPYARWGPLLCFPFYLQNVIIQPPLFMPNHPPSHSHLGHKFKYSSISPHLTESYNSLFFLFLCMPHDLGMATEPDDYQTISDNCPGYMVLISAGIICTRCAGEKRHKPNDCPKPATAADLAADNVPEADPDGTDNADSGMESLSDTSSVSSESTARSDSSEMRVTNAHQFDQGGNHPQDIQLPRHGFARPDAGYASIQPDGASLSPPDRRAARESSQYHQIVSKANGQVSEAAIPQPKTLSHCDRDMMHDPNSLVSAETYSIPRFATTVSNRLPSDNKNSSVKKWSNRKAQGRHVQNDRIQQSISYDATEDRLPSKSLADTTGKFEYSNTTCPSSFGFGRLPSEAMS